MYYKKNIYDLMPEGKAGLKIISVLQKWEEDHLKYVKTLLGKREKGNMQNNSNNMRNGRIMGMYFSFLNFPKLCNVLVLLLLLNNYTWIKVIAHDHWPLAAFL